MSGDMRVQAVEPCMHIVFPVLSNSLSEPTAERTLSCGEAVIKCRWLTCHSCDDSLGKLLKLAISSYPAAT